MFYNKKK